MLGYLSVKQASKVMNVSNSRVRQLLVSGELKGIKFASAWAIAEQDAKDFKAVGTGNGRLKVKTASQTNSTRKARSKRL